jgi:electron transport complex protein RnfC
MNTATTEQTPAVAQATETTAPAQVSAGVDNVSGVELAAAFKSRRTARGTTPAPAQSTGETKPATTEPTVTPVPAETAEASDTQSQAASAPDGESQQPVASDSAADGVAEPTQTEEVEAAAATETESEGKGIHAMQARIDKLTARLRDAERRLEEAGTKPVQPAQETAPAAPVNGVEFGHDPEVQRITREIARERAIVDWCAQNPDGGEIAGKDNQVFPVSAVEAQAYRNAAEERLADLRASRATRQNELRTTTSQVRANSDAHVNATFAWAKEEASPQNEALRMIENIIPKDVVALWPGWKTVAAYGIDAIAKAQAEKAKPVAVTVKPRPVPPKVAPAAGSTAPRVNPGDKALNEAQAAYDKNPTPNNLKRVMALRHEARRSPAVR